MGRKIYVGNLPYSATEQSLETTFAAHGTVEGRPIVVNEARPQSRKSGGGQAHRNRW
jgi:RNA recognition motif-containing protein